MTIREGSVEISIQSTGSRKGIALDARNLYQSANRVGLGCEMGISTQKLHARGPMGLEELCSYKYVIHGDGQIR